MPPEQENLNRQLEALQRYVSDLHQQRDRAKAAAAQPPPAPEPEPEPRRPSRSWLLLTGLLVTLALVGGVVGALAFSNDRPTSAKAGVAGVSSATQSPDTTTVALVASPACKTAVDRANAMLAIAVKLQGELAEYGRIMRDPSNRNLSGREVVAKTAPLLQAGASDSARFNRALADYRQIVDRCVVRTP
jgi:hypothetical protein